VAVGMGAISYRLAELHEHQHRSSFHSADR
jgi:hypothetical protein